jgi:hypothetical protein
MGMQLLNGKPVQYVEDEKDISNVEAWAEVINDVLYRCGSSVLSERPVPRRQATNVKPGTIEP